MTNFVNTINVAEKTTTPVAAELASSYAKVVTRYDAWKERIGTTKYEYSTHGHLVKVIESHKNVEYRMVRFRETKCIYDTTGDNPVMTHFSVTHYDEYGEEPQYTNIYKVPEVNEKMGDPTHYETIRTMFRNICGNVNFPDGKKFRSGYTDGFYGSIQVMDETKDTVAYRFSIYNINDNNIYDEYDIVIDKRINFATSIINNGVELVTIDEVSDSNKRKHTFISFILNEDYDYDYQCHLIQDAAGNLTNVNYEAEGDETDLYKIETIYYE